VHYQIVIDELQRAAFQIQAIEKLAQKALYINKQMYNSDGRIENYKEKRGLDKIEKQLKKKYRNYSKLVKKFGVRNFIKITSPYDSDDWDAEKAQKLGDIYYQAYQSGAHKLLMLINEAISRTQSRQEELKAEPNFNLLLKQWNQDQSYRRGTLWLTRHHSAHLPKNITKALQTIQDQFNQALTNQSTTFKTELAKRSTLPLLKSKIKLLFKHKKLDELKNLKSGFINDAKHDNKEPYLSLIDGYLAELENDIESALSNYNNIINLDNSPVLEEALLRVASISLEQQNPQNAFLAINCLAQLSPLYLPYKAELARILGDFMLAIDSYNDYINFFPENTLSKLKLAALYIEIKVYEAAELMLEHILKESPGFESAISLKCLLAKIKEAPQNTVTEA